MSTTWVGMKASGGFSSSHWAAAASGRASARAAPKSGAAGATSKVPAASLAWPMNSKPSPVASPFAISASSTLKLASSPSWLKNWLTSTFLAAGLASRIAITVFCRRALAPRFTLSLGVPRSSSKSLRHHQMLMVMS